MAKFVEKDKEKAVKLLNFISQHGKFDLEVKDIIEFFGLLSWAQKELVPKINDSIFEVVAVHEAPEEKPAKKAAKKADK